MADETPPSVSQGKSATKRSFFKKRVAAQSSANENNADVFSRSTSLFDEIIAEKQQKRRIKHGQRNERLAAPTFPVDKKRRVSETSGEVLSTPEGTDNRKENSASNDASNAQELRHTTSPLPLEEGNDNTAGESVGTKRQKVIDLASENSSEDIVLYDQKTFPEKLKSIGQTPQKESDSSDSDAEIRALAAKARERRRLKEEEQQKSHNGDVENSQTCPISQSPTSQNAALPSDRVIEILITSVIPNTKPLIVQRRLSQRLKEVRLAWCERQTFSPDVTDTVFFTWRDRRLYDVTTCKNLQFTGTRRKSHDSFYDNDEVTRVHLEAVTEEILAATKQNANSSKNFDKDKHNIDGKASEETKAEQLKVKVRAPGYEDHKLIVKPSTVISRLINAFRTARAVPAEKSITLMFDGETLPPDSTVRDFDVGDLDYIDAHIK